MRRWARAGPTEKDTIRLASRVRPWRISVITTPVRAKGSESAIIRRNSPSARPGAVLKKSIHTELSIRINRGSCAWLSHHPSRYQFRNMQVGSYGSRNAPTVPAPCPRFRAWFELCQLARFAHQSLVNLNVGSPHAESISSNNLVYVSAKHHPRPLLTAGFPCPMPALS
jgi:hypothetical protein